MSVDVFVPTPARRPPANALGWRGWARANLFSSPGNTVTTIILGLSFGWLGWQSLNWGVINALGGGATVAQCNALQVNLHDVGLYLVDKMLRFTLTR